MRTLTGLTPGARTVLGLSAGTAASVFSGDGT